MSVVEPHTMRKIGDTYPRMFDALTLDAVNAEFVRAQVKHNGRTPADREMTNAERLPILVEEVGEVARAMTYDSDLDNLVSELIQVAAMALAWVEGIER
jgi:hypothetical protein